jgi:hopene-associated glycosyltransferase HpnB
MLAVVVVSGLAALAWVYLLACHGGFWLTSQRLPAARPAARPGTGLAAPETAGWPRVIAVVPARDEASVLATSLPTLMSQDYPGALAVVLVDDQSSDGTADVAAGLAQAAGWQVCRAASTDQHATTDGPAADVPRADGRAADGRGQADQHGHLDAAGRTLRIVAGSARPAGWAGKVWAMSQGVAAAEDADYLLFTDADIAYGPGTLAGLVRAATGSDRALVSQMVLLRAATGWERVLVPAFVYFFAQLYPFRRVNRPRGRTAAAAGGCMLVRRDVLAKAGGLAAISGARIDDVALGRLLKRGAGASCWLGLTTQITSTRPYDQLADLWGMVARSAYTQLRYSPLALAGTIAGLAWLYLLPPVAGVAGLLAALAGGGTSAAWLAVTGLADWALMAISFQPMLRLYRLSPLRGLTLPLIALLYAAMTADSARRHHAGRGGEWKGRVIED